jgi:PEGA domain
VQLAGIVCVVIASAGVAHADRIVALAPLSTLGAEDTSASTKKLVGQIEAAVAGLPGTKIVPAAQVADAIKKAKKPQLKACEGDPGCLAEVGKLVGAQIVIAGEVGGLGDSKVVYLGATDVTTAKELRSTTLSFGPKADDTAASAAVRLLDPDRYMGQVHFTLDVSGATIYVNGSVVKPQNGALPLRVGTQAVRVTHPQYRDFVRFVDVGYGKTTEIAVGMQQYPIIEHDIKGNPINRDRIDYVDPPMWRRWYVVGPAAAALAIVVGVIFYDRAHSFPDGKCREVGGANC